MTSAGGHVAVGFCYGQSTQTPQWRHCYSQVLYRDAHTTKRVVCEFGREASGVNVPDARTKIVEGFLTHPAKPEWLWMQDTDATYPDDTLELLLAVADPKTRPIVGALAFGVKPMTVGGRDWFNDCLGSPLEGIPTLFTYDGDSTNRINDYPRDTLVQVHATGAHCILIHRSVLEHPGWLADKHPLPWYRTAVRAGETVSEDQFFCMKAGALGFPTFVHTGIKTGHVKTFVADEDWYLRSRFAPPATVPTAVLVPVMLRPQNAAPFMASLRASTGLATVYAICDPEDEATMLAWNDAGAEVVLSKRGPSFAQKINHGFDETSEALVFAVGDDVLFRPGWLDQAQHAMRLGAAKVVGTNDLWNPRVMSGEHSPHMLIDRAYVNDVGGGWDGPGVVCHEGYRHWFVDDELVTAAKQRDVWQFCSASMVEHLHPLAGKAETDAVYRKGQAHSDKDRRLFERRYKEFVG